MIGSRKWALSLLLFLDIVVGSFICGCSNSSSTVSTLSLELIDSAMLKPSFMSKSPQDGLFEALIYYEVEAPSIVYAQAILETGHFKSKLCIKSNNLFGLYNSRTKSYHKFDHWSESVVAYKKWIQYRYNSSEDYYVFLEKINYASDPTYIYKLKQIVKENKK